MPSIMLIYANSAITVHFGKRDRCVIFGADLKAL